jgi:hypothetical protein
MSLFVFSIQIKQKGFNLIIYSHETNIIYIIGKQWFDYV